MLSTNLLPQGQKRIVQWEEARRLVRFLAIWLSIILFVSVSLLVPSFLPLTLERRELERALTVEEDASHLVKVEDILMQGRKIRSALSAIKTFHEEPARGSLLLGWFLGGVRENVTLDGIVARKGGEVLISGVARTRRALLNYEQMLRNSGRFQDISSPVSNIIRESDINFTIKGTLKSSYAL